MSEQLANAEERVRVGIESHHPQTIWEAIEVIKQVHTTDLQVKLAAAESELNKRKEELKSIWQTMKQQGTEISALREDKARLRKFSEELAAMLQRAINDPYWKSDIGTAEKLIQRQAIDQARKK